MAVSDVQPLNEFPLVKFGGVVARQIILSNDEHPLKAFQPMLVSVFGRTA